MSTLVTGAAGFIGFHVASALLARGEAVIGIDNLNDYYDVALKQARLAKLRALPGFSFAKLDIADRAAIFDFVRFINGKADAGFFTRRHQAEVLDVLQQFDKVFAVLEDRDAEWTKFALDWAEREGRLNEASAEVLAQNALSDEQIQGLVDERTAAKKSRNFALADAIRNELAGKGIVIEDSKGGVRWKRR